MRVVTVAGDGAADRGHGGGELLQPLELVPVADQNAPGAADGAFAALVDAGDELLGGDELEDEAGEARPVGERGAARAGELAGQGREEVDGLGGAEDERGGVVGLVIAVAVAAEAAGSMRVSRPSVAVDARSASDETSPTAARRVAVSGGVDWPGSGRAQR